MPISFNCTKLGRPPLDGQEYFSFGPARESGDAGVMQGRLFLPITAISSWMLPFSLLLFWVPVKAVGTHTTCNPACNSLSPDLNEQHQSKFYLCKRRSDERV